MSIQNKPDYKVFASDAKSGEIETFPDILRGWGVTIDRTGEIPPMEWFNAIGKRVDEWLLYLTQRGVPEWDSSLDYPKSSMVMVGDNFYIAKKASKGESPSVSSASWAKLSDFIGVPQVVQSTGSSVSNVMSQDAATRLFMQHGSYGFGGNAVNVPSDSGYDGVTKTSVLRGSGVPGTPPGELSYGAVLHLQREQNRAQQISLWSGVIASRSQLNGEWGSWFYAYSEANTTKDPNGFIRASGSSVALVQGNISQSTGSSTTQVMSQKSTSDAIVGISQTWSDLTTQRSSGTTYTNTLTKAISVSITQSAGGSTTSLEITVNNVIISNPSTSASRCFITFIVPAGATYKVIASGAAITNWSELR